MSYNMPIYGLSFLSNVDIYPQVFLYMLFYMYTVYTKQFMQHS